MPDEPTLRELDPRYVPMQRVVGLITSAVLAAGGLIPLTVTVFTAPERLPWLLPLWLTGVTLLLWWTYRWPAIAYRYARYRVDPLGLEIRRGVVWRRRISVPQSRVQHTDVSQGPLERRYGLGTLVVYTAGTDHARVELPGLAYDTAIAIRDRLLPTGGDDAV